MSGGDSSHLFRMLAAQYEPPTQGQRSNKQCDREKSCTQCFREEIVHAECTTPRKFPKVSQFGEGKTRIVLISLVNEHLPSLSVTYACESRDEIPLRGEGCNTLALILLLTLCLIAN